MIDRGSVSRAVLREQVADRRPLEVAEQGIEPRLATTEIDVMPEAAAPRQAVDPRLSRIDLPRVNVEDVRHAAGQDAGDAAAEEAVREETEVAAAAPRNALLPEPQHRDAHFAEAVAEIGDGRARFHAAQFPVAIVSDGRKRRRVVGDPRLAQDRNRPVRDRKARRAVAVDRLAGEILQELDGAVDVLPELIFAERIDEVVAVAVRRAATIPDFVRFYNVTIMNPTVLVGIFLGVMLAFVFCAMTMKAVGRAANKMVEEVRRQFKEIPGIMEGNADPDYASCVAISTAAAQKEMVVPALLGIVTPIVIGLVLGVGGVMGMLAGGLTGGFAVAIMMANAGGAWDNAKKYIEAGAHGGKGTDNHKATVVGDTVGDPFKDTSGPSLNILIKLMSMVSVVFAGFVVQYALQLF